MILNTNAYLSALGLDHQRWSHLRWNQYRVVVILSTVHSAIRNALVLLGSEGWSVGVY